MEEGKRGRGSNSSSSPRQGSPGLRKPNSQTATESKRTKSLWGEAWASGLSPAGGGGVGSTSCSQRQVPSELSAPGQNCVKVAGLSGKLLQPLANTL